MARFDTIGTGLYHDQARTRLEDKVLAQVTESNIGVWGQEDAKLFGDRLRVIAVGLGEKSYRARDESDTLCIPEFLPEAQTLI